MARLASSDSGADVEDIGMEDVDTAEQIPSSAIAYSAREAVAVALIRFESRTVEAVHVEERTSSQQLSDVGKSCREKRTNRQHRKIDGTRDDRRSKSRKAECRSYLRTIKFVVAWYGMTAGRVGTDR